MAQHTFTVGQIHCGACETAIGKSLRRVDGVRHVGPDAATNTVTVVFDEQLLDLGRLAARLEAAGYPVLA